MQTIINGVLDRRPGTTPPQVRIILTPSATCTLVDVITMHYRFGQPSPTRVAAFRLTAFPAAVWAAPEGVGLAKVLREAAAILEA